MKRGAVCVLARTQAPRIASCEPDKHAVEMSAIVVVSRIPESVRWCWSERDEAFLLIVVFLVAVLAYIWRRLGEPSPPHVDVPYDKRTNLDW